MEQIETYLTVADFAENIPGIPTSFSLATIQPYWAQLRRNWLRQLIAADNSFWSATPASYTPAQTTLLSTLKLFAVYAIWADYVLQGNVQQTQSGLVQKANEQSDYVDASQRAALHRKYLDLATVQAQELLLLATTPTACSTVIRAAGGVRIGSVMPNSRPLLS